jgi:hypothetical protein
MTSFLIAFLSLSLLLGAFAYVAVPAASRGRRALIAGSFAVILGALFFGYSDMLGRPKSTRLEVFRISAQDAKIIGSYLKENDGVYLWLQLPGLDEPRYYKLPWDEKVAKALQDAIGENERQHGSGVNCHSSIVKRRRPSLWRVSFSAVWRASARSLARMIIMLRSPIWPASRKGPLATKTPLFSMATRWRRWSGMWGKISSSPATGSLKQTNNTRCVRAQPNFASVPSTP